MTFHRAIVTLQLLKLASYGFAVAVAFATSAAPPINDPSAPNIGKIGNIPPQFAVGSTRFFIFFFFVFTFVFTFIFIPMPIFVLAFIAAKTAAAAALSSIVEFLAIIRFRTFSASILLATCRSVRSLLCE